MTADDPWLADAHARFERPLLLYARRLSADPAAAENVLRYYETHLRADGSFQFQALAPGKYWVLTRQLPEDYSLERPPRPVAWESTERAKLRREAEAAKQELALTACQRLSDYKLTAK